MLRHLVFLLLPAVAYLYPAEPVHSASASSRVLRNIAHTQEALGKTATSIALVDQSRDVIWQDPELRAAAQAWHGDGRRGDGAEGTAQLKQHLRSMLQRRQKLTNGHT